MWCVPHQLDIVVKNTTNGILNERFYKTAHTFSVHLCDQQNLITDMSSKCSKDTTRYIAFDRMLSWLLQHCRQMMEHFADKRLV